MVMELDSVVRACRGVSSEICLMVHCSCCRVLRDKRMLFGAGWATTKYAKHTKGKAGNGVGCLKRGAESECFDPWRSVFHPWLFSLLLHAYPQFVPSPAESFSQVSPQVPRIHRGRHAFRQGDHTLEDARRPAVPLALPP